MKSSERYSGKWLRNSDGKWAETGSIASDILEELYLKFCLINKPENPNSFYTLDDVDYEVDFNKMEQKVLKKSTELQSIKRIGGVFSTLGIALVICRNKEGKWLSVNESGDRGWWLPGGLVDPPEDFITAGIRETIEEAGVDVEIKGVLRIEYQNYQSADQRLKFVLYAEPIDQNQKPKSVPDYESIEARYVSIPELIELRNKPPHWRGEELFRWANYIEQGGTIYPLGLIKSIGSNVEMIKPVESASVAEKELRQLREEKALLERRLAELTRKEK